MFYSTQYRYEKSVQYSPGYMVITFFLIASEGAEEQS